MGEIKRCLWLELLRRALFLLNRCVDLALVLSKFGAVGGGFDIGHLVDFWSVSEKISRV